MGKAAKKRPGTALINVEQELRDAALLARATEESVQTGQFFGTKGGVLTFNGAPIKDNEMQVIILDHILVNALYVGKFDPANPVPPVCYAFGRDDKQLKPHEKSSDPQAEKCPGCPQNEYGTADTGRGKACKNTRRLACMSASLLDQPDSVVDGQVAYLGVPVTSIKGWAGFVRQVADTFGIPPLGVVTKVKLVADTKDQFKMVFSVVERIGDKRALSLLIQKSKEVAKQIDFPFPDLEDMPKRQAAAPRGRKTAAPARAARAAPAKPAAAAKAAPAKGAPGFGQARKF